MFKITKWYGRFGNNLTQLGTAIYYALANKHNAVSFPMHPNLKSTCINLDPNGVSEFVSGIFFNDTTQFPRPSFDQLHDVIKNYVTPIVTFLDIRKDEKIFDCVLHVRGGDTFRTMLKVHPGYVPVPLDYFLAASSPFEKVGIIAEDNKHPALRYLLKNEKFFQLSSGRLEEDIRRMTCSKHIIAGPGSFWRAAVWLSSECRAVTIPAYPPVLKSPYYTKSDSINFRVIPLEGYINHGNWRNSFLQRRKIIKYRLSTSKIFR